MEKNARESSLSGRSEVVALGRASQRRRQRWGSLLLTASAQCRKVLAAPLNRWLGKVGCSVWKHVSLIRQSVGLLQPVSLGTGVTVCTRGTYTLLPSTGCLVSGTWRVLVTHLPLPALFLLCTNKHVFRGLDGKEDQGREWGECGPQYGGDSAKDASGFVIGLNCGCHQGKAAHDALSQMTEEGHTSGRCLILRNVCA